MLSPSAAPRWNSTTNCFLPAVEGVAAIARCRNAGIALNPTIAIPPCFRKYRRENFKGRTPWQHRSLMKTSLLLVLTYRVFFLRLFFRAFDCQLPSLKFRSAQHQARDYSQVHVLHRV